MAGKMIEINPGQQFGMLTAMHEGERRLNSRNYPERMFVCKCKCGIIKPVPVTKLNTGRATSCGCAAIVHGMSKHPLRKILCGIKSRCYNAKNPSYERYGGRGITMCEDWFRNVEPFVQWAISNGWKKGLHVDRIDNNGPYSPENCRISTPKQNDRNKRHSQMLTYNGITRHARDWADEIGMNYCTIRDRIKYGWTAEDVLLRPVDKRITGRPKKSA